MKCFVSGVIQKERCLRYQSVDKNEFPADTVYAPKWEFKINSEVYDKAVFKILKKVKNIPHANKRHKIGINKYIGATFYLISIIKNKILKLIRIKKINPIAGEGSWISFKEYAKSKEILLLWKKINDLDLYKDMLSIREFTFSEIIKRDYKLIYKCLVLNKILNHNSDRLDD